MQILFCRQTLANFGQHLRQAASICAQQLNSSKHILRSTITTTTNTKSSAATMADSSAAKMFNSLSSLDDDSAYGAPDWSKVAVPVDDGAAEHLTGISIDKDVALASTGGGTVSLGSLPGRTVVFAFPRPGIPILPLDQWDALPGARGCTPHTCAFRDKADELRDRGVSHIFALATQNIEFLGHFARKHHLPFPVLSDEHLALANAMGLPTMCAPGSESHPMLKRLAMVIDNGRVTKVFYPVFPPDKNADEVLQWLNATAAEGGN